MLASGAGVLISLAIAEQILTSLEDLSAGLRSVLWGQSFNTLVLRQYCLWANRWVLASAVAVAIGMAVGQAFDKAVASSRNYCNCWICERR